MGGQGGVVEARLAEIDIDKAPDIAISRKNHARLCGRAGGSANAKVWRSNDLCVVVGDSAAGRVRYGDVVGGALLDCGRPAISARCA